MTQINLDTLQAVIAKRLDIARSEGDTIVKELGPEVSVAYWSGKRDALLLDKSSLKFHCYTSKRVNPICWFCCVAGFSRHGCCGTFGAVVLPSFQQSLWSRPAPQRLCW